MTHSNRPASRRKSPRKPKKPSSDFPLFPHASGYWAKKVNGKLVYFTKWRDDSKGKDALKAWLEQRDDLLAGRTPRVKADDLTLRDYCNKFLTFKSHQVQTDEITRRTFVDYKETCEIIVKQFGRDRLVTDIRPDDFEGLRATLADGRSAVSLGNHIQRIRTVFKYFFDAGLIDSPIRFGTFKKPSAKVLRVARAKRTHEHGKRMFSADELRMILNTTSVQLRAMVLLAINCGFGQSDCSGLPLSVVKNALKTGWLDYARGKTGVERRCPLWPETKAALTGVLDKRRPPKDAAFSDFLFITKYGTPWVKTSAQGKPDDAVCKEMAKLLKQLGIKRQGVNFYAIRHTFQTIGSQTGDETAVGALMGHVDNSMSAVYREELGDTRLQKVSDHVRQWLFSELTDGKPTEGDKASAEDIESTEDQSQVTDESNEPFRLRVVG